MNAPTGNVRAATKATGQDALDLEQPTREQLENMMLNAGKEFDERLPDLAGGPNVEEETEKVLVLRDDGKFDWDNDPSILFQRQPATAMYENPCGGLVIRQEADWNEEGDIVVTIAPDLRNRFLDHLCDMQGIPTLGG